jgi:plastocyanin
MKINLFYALLAVIVYAAVFTFFPGEEKEIVETSTISYATPTPPPPEVLTSATSPLSPPTNLAGQAVESRTIFLTWDASTDAGTQRYRIVRNDLLIAEVVEPRFADSQIITGKKYGYYIQAIDGLGRFSQPSNFIIVSVSNPVARVPSATVTNSTTTPKNTDTSVNTNTRTTNTNTTIAPVNTPVISVPPTTNTTNTPSSILNTNSTPTNTSTNTNTTSNTNTTTYTPVNYSITVTENGVFSPLTRTIHTTDSITFTYISGEGDEVILSFTPTIGTTVKLDHDHTTRTITFSTAGTYTFKKSGSSQTGTITVTAP